MERIYPENAESVVRHYMYGWSVLLNQYPELFWLVDLFV